MTIKLNEKQADFLWKVLHEIEMSDACNGSGLSQEELQGRYANSPEHPAMILHGMVRSIAEQLERGAE